MYYAIPMYIHICFWKHNIYMRPVGIGKKFKAVTTFADAHNEPVYTCGEFVIHYVYIMGIYHESR